MLLESICYAILAIALVFATCEIGHRLENTFNEINYAFCQQLEWYYYPIEVQRMLVQTLIYTQQPVAIKFFGSIACSREQFKGVRSFSTKNIIDQFKFLTDAACNNFFLNILQVMNSGYSCFMVLRRFYK